MVSFGPLTYTKRNYQTLYAGKDIYSIAQIKETISPLALAFY